MEVMMFDEYIFVEWFRIISTFLCCIYVIISLDVFGKLKKLRLKTVPETALDTASETAPETTPKTAIETAPETDDDAFEDWVLL